MTADVRKHEFGDPAIVCENNQNYHLSLACKPCVHHRYDEEGHRHCYWKKLKGNEMSMCGDFRPRDLRDPRLQLRSIFEEPK